jgi:serine/threonine protein kinase
MGHYSSMLGVCAAAAVKKISVSLDTVGFPPDSDVLKAHTSPNLLRFFGYQVDRDFHYFAFELSHGDLFGFLESRWYLPESEYNAMTMSLARGIGGGLQYLHDHDMLHGNLTPSNIHICYESDGGATTQPVVKLCNFGVKRNLTYGPAFSSIQNWMAPESTMYSDYVGTFTTSRPSDMFSLGCVLFYLYSRGGHAFCDDEDPTFIMYHIKQGHRRSNRLAGPYSVLTDALLCVNPDERLTIGEVVCHPLLLLLKG